MKQGHQQRVLGDRRQHPSGGLKALPLLQPRGLEFALPGSGRSSRGRISTSYAIRPSGVATSATDTPPLLALCLQEQAPG